MTVIRSSKDFFIAIGGQYATYGAMRDTIVATFNMYLEAFPPDYTYAQMLDWGITNGWIYEESGRWLVCYKERGLFDYTRYMHDFREKIDISLQASLESIVQAKGDLRYNNEKSFLKQVEKAKASLEGILTGIERLNSVENVR